METFRDLWYQITNAEKQFHLFGHKFIKYNIHDGKLRYIYICDNCKISVIQREATILYNRVINVYNPIIENNYGFNYSLDTILDNHIITCDEMTIKQIIE